MACAVRPRRVHQHVELAACLSRMLHVAAAPCSSVMEQHTLTDITVMWYRTMLQQQLTAAPSFPAQHRTSAVAVVGAAAAVAVLELLEVPIACEASIACGREGRADEE